MGQLSVDRLLKEHCTDDAASVSALNLTHRALSNVSCLSEFKNLKRLDLGFNGLTSLEDLRSCSNLKWLSVVQNKLETLRGVESLSKLTAYSFTCLSPDCFIEPEYNGEEFEGILLGDSVVLNAGKNKLTSMEEVGSLGSLCALILNDNEIASICKLDRMKELNTVVLSRNPIQKIGKSLSKVTSLSKLSLSSCQIYDIGTSLEFCTELRELRLAHNHIKALPAKLAYNTKLSNLDLGNNLFARWSDMEVLKSLVNLKNLNLLGNPVMENDKLMKKIRKVLPGLNVFNAKPTNKRSKIENNLEVDMLTELRPTATESPQGEEKYHRNGKSKKISGHRDQIMDADEIKPHTSEKEEKGKRKKKKLKEDPLEQQETTFHKVDVTVKKKARRESMKPVLKGLDAIDDTEASFLDLIETESVNLVKDKKQTEETLRTIDGGNIHIKKKMSKKKAFDDHFESPAIEIGMGGASTWGE